MYKIYTIMKKMSTNFIYEICNVYISNFCCSYAKLN